MLTDVVKSCHQRALDQQKAEGQLRLERGFATIHLPGIDVPFHSRYLWDGVMPFRACMSSVYLFDLQSLTQRPDLSKKINAANLNPNVLIGKHIPKLIANPFDLS